MATMTELLEKPTHAVKAPHYAVRSTWTGSPVQVDGFLGNDEWRDAGVLNLPRGFLMVKNDATTLWLALDIIDDAVEDPGVLDHFCLFIDVDGNGKPTGYRDLYFSTLPGGPDRLGRWLIAPNGGVLPSPTMFSIASKVRKSFGVSLMSARPHRVWELALKLDEIDPALLVARSKTIVRAGVYVRSAEPLFVLEVPPKLELERFIEIALATGPAPKYDRPGAVIGGVGLVSALDIDPKFGTGTIRREREGLYLVNAAFGGTLDFFANVQTIKNALAGGAKTFAIRHRVVPANETVDEEAPWMNLVTNWTNALWRNGSYVDETFGANAQQRYRLIDPEADYRLKPLLFQWNSTQELEGLHQFELDFFDAGGAKIAVPQQRVTLRIHNRAPEVQILDIEVKDRAGQKSTTDGESVTMNGPYDCLVPKVMAYDKDGFLEGYQLVARYDSGKSEDVLQDFHTWQKGTAAEPGTLWEGVREQAVLFCVPASGAYLFRLNALGRVTDGYQQLLYSEAFRTMKVTQPYPDINEHRVSERHIEPPLRLMMPPRFDANGYFVP